MTLQTVPGGLWMPPPMGKRNSNPTFSALTIDAVDEIAAQVLQAPKTGTISKIGWSTRTVTTGATVDVRVESVSLTDGNPTGTLLGTDSNGAQVVDDTDDNTWFTTELTTGVAVTKGDLLAISIVNPASDEGDMQIGAFSSAFGFTRGGFPYAVLFTSSWTKQTSTVLGVAPEYSDGSYAAQASPLAFPYTANLVHIFNNSDSPDEVGLKFKLPFPARVSGFWLWGGHTNDFDIVLYDSDGSSVLITISLDGNVREFNGNATNMYTFAGTVELAKDTFYRCVIKPTTASDIRVNEVTAASAAVLDATYGGQNFHLTERTNAGLWTDTTNKQPLMGLIFDAFDDGAGGGGGGGIRMAGHGGLAA